MAKTTPTKPGLAKSTKKPASGWGGARANSGGPRPNSGRTSKAAMLGLVALLDNNWPVEARAESVRKLSEMAAEGNIDAIKLLYSYAFGKPKETKEVSGLDGGAIRVVVAYEDRPIDDRG